jgi:hypothetical protein
MKHTDFETMLTGGHPNSLGNTVEVVSIVLADNSRFEELFECYFSSDEVVRLRVSSALKRVQKSQPELVYSYIDRLLDEISTINQASTQWTLAQLFLNMTDELTAEQLTKAKSILKHNLTASQDWIVIIQTLKTLVQWSAQDEQIKDWVISQLHVHAHDTRKSVSKNASKLLSQLSS